jgi:hypothetical protein
MSPPIAMAAGGYVQSFRDGSDEEGVTPSRESSSFPAGTFSPDEIEAARQGVLARLAQGPLPVPDLSAQTETRIPLYEKLLGADKNLSQAQILFELGQRAFNYGANVDDQGRPLLGSQAARLAGAVRTLPGSMGNIMAQQGQQERAVRAAALQAAEKDVQGIRDQNVKLSASQDSLRKEMLKQQGKRGDTLFGSSLTGRFLNLFNEPGLMQAYGEGLTTTEQSNEIQTAITDYLKPTRETYTNDLGYTVSRIIRPDLPEHVQEALNNRKSLGFGTARAPQSTATTRGGEATPELDFSNAVTLGRTSDQRPETPPVKRYKQTESPLQMDPDLHDFYNPDDQTMYNSVEGTGVWPTISDISGRIPIFGSFVGSEEAAKQKRFLQQANLKIQTSLAENPRFSDTEQARIAAAINLLPKLIDRPEAYAMRLKSLDDLLATMQKAALRTANDKEIPKTASNEARAKLNEIVKGRTLIGAPLIIEDTAAGWEKVKQLPVGTRYLYKKRGQPPQVIEVYE